MFHSLVTKRPNTPNSPKPTDASATKRSTRLSAVLFAAVLMVAGCSVVDSELALGDDDGSSAESASADSTVAGGTDADETGTTGAVDDNQESHVDADDLVYDDSDVVNVELDSPNASDGVVVDGATITITAAGVYSLSGTITDGQVIVDAGDSDDVILILDGVGITNTDGAAIAVMNADEATILLADGTTNSLTDGSTYTFPDAETDEPNAALYSAADLTIAGGGELVVAGNFNDGIASKDGLVIDSGTVVVAALDDGIRGKDYVIIGDAAVSVEAGGDGIKADNDEDAERGYVQMTSGSVTVTSGDDGLQAATDVIISGGELTIAAGSNSDDGRAIVGDVMVTVSGGVIDATATDDAVHSNGEIAIADGALTLEAGDDGVHADELITIDGGSITITRAFEGIESEVIVINDGVIDITSTDDGLNVASAEAVASTEVAPQRGGRGGDDEAVGEHYIYINGGTTTITVLGDLAEQGDGIDANGHVEMSGGLVVVSGPTDTRNSALDYSGGSFVMTGGTFIGSNINGRNSQGIGVGSSQASILVELGSAIVGGTVIDIESADGQNLVTFEPVNVFDVVVFSSPELIAGESYDVYLGGDLVGSTTATA